MIWKSSSYFVWGNSREWYIHRFGNDKCILWMIVCCFCWMRISALYCRMSRLSTSGQHVNCEVRENSRRICKKKQCKRTQPSIDEQNNFLVVYKNYFFFPWKYLLSGSSGLSVVKLCWNLREVHSGHLRKLMRSLNRGNWQLTLPRWTLQCRHFVQILSKLKLCYTRPLLLSERRVLANIVEANKLLRSCKKWAYDGRHPRL